MKLFKELTWDKVKAWLKKILQLLFNPRLLLCLLIGWMITNGWSYILLGLGILFQITWMQAVAAAYLGLLWIPFTPEKILTVMIAIFLLRILFPKDEKTLGVLNELFQKEKQKRIEAKERRRQKKEERKNRENNQSKNTE